MRRVYNKLNARIAVSEAARWTAERYYGGRYRIIPNGVDLDAAPTGPRPESEELRLLFVGRAEERKGLPVLLRAFEALVGTGVRARLSVVGPTPAEVAPYLLDESEGVDVVGPVTDEEQWQLLHDSDLLCAPSLAARASGWCSPRRSPRARRSSASDIAGYTDVARDGVDGVLVPPADPRARPGSPRPRPRARAPRAHAAAALERAQRFGWPKIAAQADQEYEEAQRHRPRHRTGDRAGQRLRSADLKPIQLRPAPVARPRAGRGRSPGTDLPAAPRSGSPRSGASA